LKTEEWFGEWFDSPYYHILYKHRDEDEARAFIDRLSVHMDLRPDHLILDLACGKGRHAIYLNQKGFNVVGLDLSTQNIAFARKFENNRLKFYQHDMRAIWKKEKFDIILNLFTSFGYFDTEQENQLAIGAMAKSLVKGGKLLIDFLNPYTVIHNLVPQEIRQVDGITFYIRKFLSENGYIIKDIEIEERNSKQYFQERVKAIRRVRFLEYFQKAGLTLNNIFGDYDLNDYKAEQSERMIFLLTK
jgi:SAM-dependent methyltransferase